MYTLKAQLTISLGVSVCVEKFILMVTIPTAYYLATLSALIAVVHQLLCAGLREWITFHRDIVFVLLVRFEQSLL